MMRIRIGIPFKFNKTWIGGTYYVLNLIRSLNMLDEYLKPEILLFSDKENFRLAKEETNYPYFKRKKPIIFRFTLLEKVINYPVKLIAKRRLLYRKIKGISGLYPVNYVGANMYNRVFKDFEKLIFWIPDMQEKYYPQFFSEQEIEHRANQYRLIGEKGKIVVFSSNMAKLDFETNYPEFDIKKFVLKFAVHHQKINENNFAELSKVYSLKESSYFIISNQFWVHKNHLVAFKAASILKQRNIEITIVCTGYISDNRNPAYYDEIESFIKKNQLEKNIRLVGFVHREDQLLLLKKSIAVIQPSLFEGWSTIVEDAKCLGKHLIISEFPVHREQVSNNADFFDPEDELQLAEILQRRIIEKPKDYNSDYFLNQVAFGKDFMNILKNINN